MKLLHKILSISLVGLCALGLTMTVSSCSDQSGRGQKSTTATDKAKAAAGHMDKAAGSTTQDH